MEIIFLYFSLTIWDRPLTISQSYKFNLPLSCKKRNFPKHFFCIWFPLGFRVLNTKFWCGLFNNTIRGILCFATPTKKLCAQKSNLKLGKKFSKGFMKKSKGIRSLLHVTHPNMKDNFNTYVHHRGYNICTTKIKTNVRYTYTYITSYNKWFIYTTLYNMYFLCMFIFECRYLYHIL